MQSDITEKLKELKKLLTHSPEEGVFLNRLECTQIVDDLIFIFNNKQINNNNENNKAA